MKTQIQFKQIDRIALFGGSWLMAELCRKLVHSDFKVKLFTSPRHLQDVVDKNSHTLEQVLKGLELEYSVSEDINHEPAVRKFVTDKTIGLAIGAAWTFSPELVAVFGGRFLDFMGINLPQMRGGAHYTWQILMGDRKGSCNLQLVYGGEETFHRGEIIKRQEYSFSDSARTPQDYFDEALKQEMPFLTEFFSELKKEKIFTLTKLDEKTSTYWPFLYTRRHGFIDWQWNSKDIERFMGAFDDPYDGASTFVQGKRVFLKQAQFLKQDGAFHPFQSGFVYRIENHSLFVATRDGTVIVKKVLDENKKDIFDEIHLGQRFYTPSEHLQAAMEFDAVYGASGVRKD